MQASGFQKIQSRIASSSGRLWPVWSAGVLLLLLAVLWTELQARENLDALWAAFVTQLGEADLYWLLFALGLMPLNWLAETRKWHCFVRRFEPMSLGRAMLAVWVGVSFSMFTPNRIGEYGGRILFVLPANRWKAALYNVVGNFSQMLVLLTAGVWGLWVFQGIFKPEAFRPLLHLGWFGIAALGLAFLLYLNLPRVISRMRRLPIPARWLFLSEELAVLQDLNNHELIELLAWAVLRYGIYATQYYLLLRFFGINTGLTDGYAGIATIFLIQTSLPLPPLTALVARGNVALLVWTFLGANAVSSLAATFALWIINLILPALIGTFSLFYVKITKSPGYECITNIDS